MGTEFVAKAAPDGHTLVMVPSSHAINPKAQLRGVAGSGVAPVEEVMARRADVVPIDCVPWVAMGRKLTALSALPKETNCQNSTEKAAPVGMAIDKNQPALLAWTRAVEEELEAKLKTDEARIVDTMK